MARKKKIEIFKLEDRVLFEAAGAVEAIAAESLAEDANPDQQNEISESERQEKEAQSVAKDAGPATVNEPGKTVQEVGGGLFQKKSEQQNPNQALPDDHVVFSGVTDPNDAFSTAISNFLNTDFSEQPYSADASASSDADASDTRELLILDAETARDFNRDLLPENTEILVLDNDSDAAEQVDSFLESGDTKYDSIKVVGDADLDTDVLQSHLTEHGELVLNAALDFEVPADYADDPFHDTVIHPEVNENITIDAVEAEQLDPALAADVAEDRNELVIINSNIAEKETVLSQLGDGYEVLEIDPNQDAMSQIQDYLDTHSDTKYDAVHVLTHGNDQGFYLGSTKVTEADQMSVFNGHMADNGDFMLYGCNLASSEHGQSLVQDIADFTGCDVAASTNITGAAALGGDWILEYNTGVIETTNISLNADWSYRLNTIRVDSGEENDKDKGIANTLTIALGWAEDGDQIDIESDNTGTAEINKAVTIQADSYKVDTITINVTGVTLKGTNYTDVTIRAEGGIVDSVFTISGTFKSEGNIEKIAKESKIYTNDNGQIQIISGTVSGSEFYASGKQSVITIQGGNLNGSGFSSSGDGSYINISGGTFENSTFESSNASSGINISGGTFDQGSIQSSGSGDITITNKPAFNSVPITQSGRGNIDIQDGTFSGDGVLTGITVSGTGKLTVESGSFSNFGTAIQIGKNINAEISGGNFENNASYDIDNSGTVTLSREASLGGNVNNQDSAAFNMSDESVVNGTITNFGTVTVSADAFLNKLKVESSGSFEITGGIVNSITVVAANTGMNKISGGTVYELDNGEGSTIEISGGGIGKVTNAGILTVQGGAFGAYLKEGSYTYGKIKNESTGEITFKAGFDDQVGLITNKGIITIENSAILNIETGNGETAFTNEGTLTVNGEISNTSTPPGEKGEKGTGIRNVSGGTVTSGSSGTIKGFAFGAWDTDGTLPSTLNYTHNSYDFLNVLIVEGKDANEPSKDKNKYFYSLQDALDKIHSDTTNPYAIAIRLNLAEHDSWNDYLVVNNSYELSNLCAIASETVVPVKTDKESVILTITLNGTLTLATDIKADGGTTTFHDISLTVSENAAFTVNGGAAAHFEQEVDKIIESVITSPIPDATLTDGYVSLTNHGQLIVNGGDSEDDGLTFTYNTLINAEMNAVENYGKLILKDGNVFNIKASGVNSEVANLNGIRNTEGGTLTISNAILSGSASDKSLKEFALIRNDLPPETEEIRVNKTPNLAITDSILNMVDTREFTNIDNYSVYGILNFGKTIITDSSIDVTDTRTESKSYGLYNGNNAIAEYRVTKVPTASTFEQGISGKEYLYEIYHINSSDYAVYNRNQFTTTLTVSSTEKYQVVDGLLTGTIEGVGDFQYAPLYALIGDVYTYVRTNTPDYDGSDRATTTSLNQITVEGNISNFGTADVLLDDVRLNGEIKNTISSVKVTGAFTGSNFLYILTEPERQDYIYDGAITVWNYNYSVPGTNAGGSIWFGSADGNEVAFDSNLNYAFYNINGEMSFYHFSGLSTKANPVQIYNQGQMTIQNTNGIYDLYVKEAEKAKGLLELNVNNKELTADPDYEISSANQRILLGKDDGVYSTATGISDYGILNVNVNGYDGQSPVNNSMTLEGVYVRNTQDAAAAITNYGGKLAITGGGVAGTYSGLDNLEVIAYISDASAIDYYVVTPVVNLSGLTEIIGAAYSVRNVGELNITGGETPTLFTNITDKFISKYNGDYVAVANTSVSVAIYEFNYSTNPDRLTDVTFNWKTAFTGGSKTLSPGTLDSLINTGISLYQMTADSYTVRVACDLSYARSQLIIQNLGTYTGDRFGSIFSGDITIDHVSFTADMRNNGKATAFENGGNLVVSGIDRVLQFKGFNFVIDNYFDSWARGRFGNLKEAGEYAYALTPTADLEIGFTIRATNIYRNGTLDYEYSKTGLSGYLTLRGIEIINDKGEYEYTLGTINAEADAVQINAKARLDLINFSVTSGENGKYQWAIQNEGQLGIYNGHYDSTTGKWIGAETATAYIEAKDRTAILNRGALEIVNGAVINSAIGIYNTELATKASIVNTTIANNSQWGIVSDMKKGDFTVAYSTVALNGKEENGGGIQLLNGKLTLVNSIVLNPEGTYDIQEQGGTLLAQYRNSNIYGSSVSETAQLTLSVYGTAPFLDSEKHVISLLNDPDNPALNRSVAWQGYAYDQLGNERLPVNGAIGAYILTGGTKVTVKVNIWGEDDDSSNDDWSLREVIEWLQSSENINKNMVVEFDWERLQETGDAEQWTFKLLDIFGGSLKLSSNNAAGISSITIDALYTSDDPGRLTINGDALTDSVFSVDGMELILANLTINGSGTETASVDANGAAVRLEGTSTLSLNGNVTIKDGYTKGDGGAVFIGTGALLTFNGANAFLNNHAGNGGAIYNTGSTLAISNTTFSGNTASGNGGAIYNTGSTLTVADSNFSGNSGKNGGALYNGSGKITVTDTTFNHNSSDGAVIISSSNLTITGGSFENNSGTGSLVKSEGTVMINDTTFTDNANNGDLIAGRTIIVNGGSFARNIDNKSVVNASGDVIITDVVFEANKSRDSIIAATGNVTVTDGSFTENKGNQSVINAGGDVALENGVRFIGNESSDSVVSANGDITVNVAGFERNQGAGSLLNSVNGDMLIDGSIFAGNTNTGDLIIGQSITVNGGSFENNTNNTSVINATSGDVILMNVSLRENESSDSVVVANGNVTVTGGNFTENTGNQSVIDAGGDVTLENGVTFIGNESSDSVVVANGNVTVDGGSFMNNRGTGSLIKSNNTVTVNETTFTGNTNMGDLITGQSVTVNSGNFTDNTGNESMINATDSVTVQESVFHGNGTQTLIKGRDVILNESSIYENTATGAIASGSNRLFVVSTTIAENSAALDLQGGDVTVVNSTIAEASGILIEGNNVQIANSIVVTKDNSDAVAGAEVAVAYSAISGKVNTIFADGMKSGLSYADVFGNNTLTNGFISLPADSPAMQGVWTAIDYGANEVYYSTIPDGIWVNAYNKETVSWNLLGRGAIGGISNVGKNAEFVSGRGGDIPNMGAVWNITWRPDSGPGVNDTFIDPSFNGIGWNNDDIYNIVADNLVMNSGFLLNFRNEMPVGGHWYYDFTHVFDDRYSTMDRFAVTQGRFDLGIIPSGETYITINVNGNISDDFTRYTTTPYLSDGTPLIPEELESMNPEITAPAEAVFTFPAELEEKVMSYLRRAEIFKDDYDKALDSFLKV